MRIHFQTEYHNQLIQRHCEISQCLNLKIYDVVLIAEDIQKVLDCSIGKIMCLISGRMETFEQLIKILHDIVIRHIQLVFSLLLPHISISQYLF